MNNSITIVWADDEIDLLKPQILYLENKGYSVLPVTNGQDALDACAENDVDVVILDESMPGLTGLETLTKIKSINTHLPIIMVTKNEEEDLMEDAIGAQITDYLIKPVKPQQILSSVKKITDNKRLVSERTNSQYQQQFQSLFMALQEDLDWRDWGEFYKKLIYWELEFQKSETAQMEEVFSMQKGEANREFFKFVKSNYLDWVKSPEAETTPLLSPHVLKEKLFKCLQQDKTTVLVVIDNLRFDQWKMIQPLISSSFKLEEEDFYYSILPTATQYARNSLFAGLHPADIEAHFPNYWLNDHEEGGKNQYEAELLDALLDRSFRDEIKSHYIKVTNHSTGKDLEDNIQNLMHNKLVTIVYNFVDMLSHARTEMEVLKELASDEAAYRSLSLSWFEHSPLHNALKKIADKDINLIITTDHGTIRVNNPSKCIGDKQTTSNIRYKNGRNLNYNEKDVFVVKDPAKAKLPKPNVSTSYIFAKEDYYLVYPNNYNHYVKYFDNTFQHGGISMEEMIVPVISFTSK